MPATGKVRRSGQKLPSGAVACEQCTAKIKKSARDEFEQETPTRRFLIKFASHLSSQLPAAIVQGAMKKARGHAGGTGKIVKIETEIKKAAGTLNKEVAGYRAVTTDEEQHTGQICSNCNLFSPEGDDTFCNIVEGNIGLLAICLLFQAKPGSVFVKAASDTPATVLGPLFATEGGDAETCEFNSPDEAG